MSFRCKQKFHTCPCSGVGIFESITLETGFIVTRLEDACTKDMPNSDLFDLETNLKAGVNLEEVGSKILGGSQASLDFTEFENNNNNNHEVNNNEN